ncbi:hypothetical protein SAMN04487884_15010 [Butyrivibrio fibrisolvens]|uniref:Uncharacterized protein n=1 Tax=Butyrivibrio fibrisolvens TaxID=831 RepID=A0A1H9X9S4_BUTFI|nr:hypothetical protein [Butyrivibrio fibrisolvens]SES42801.1 hypothetical protein SAMN04487884_15010 [Butyrivibrio fibrisolvens]
MLTFEITDNDFHDIKYLLKTPVIKRFIKSPMVSKIMGRADLNRPEDLKKAKDKFHAIQDWADAHPQYKDKTAL